MGNHVDYYQPRIAYEHVRKLYALGRLLKKPMTGVLADILVAAFQRFAFTEEDGVTAHVTVPTYRAELREPKLRKEGEADGAHRGHCPTDPCEHRETRQEGRDDERNANAVSG